MKARNSISGGLIALFTGIFIAFPSATNAADCCVPIAVNALTGHQYIQWSDYQCCCPGTGCSTITANVTAGYDHYAITYACGNNWQGCDGTKVPPEWDCGNTVAWKSYWSWDGSLTGNLSGCTGTGCVASPTVQAFVGQSDIGTCTCLGGPPPTRCTVQ